MAHSGSGSEVPLEKVKGRKVEDEIGELTKKEDGARSPGPF